VKTARAEAQPKKRVETPCSDTKTQKEASDLLEETGLLSSRLRVDADQLEAYTRSKLSWQSHGDQLTRVKEHINPMGGRLEGLQEIRRDSVWQAATSAELRPSTLTSLGVPEKETHCG
jgi:hypothetical protein